MDWPESRRQEATATDDQQLDSSFRWNDAQKEGEQELKTLDSGFRQNDEQK
ncbi:MAG TPA: hypothetical protein PKD77_07210 [Rudaea sp.]|jgi:hypothetical protein|nr:hypothetical protein [Rudaea sp.]